MYKILFYHVQTKGFQTHLNHKISDVEAREGGGVLIMCACLSVCVVFVFSSVSMRVSVLVPCISNTFHDSLVSSHGYTGILGGDNDRGGDGVCRSSHIYHPHRNNWT